VFCHITDTALRRSLLKNCRDWPKGKARATQATLGAEGGVRSSIDALAKRLTAGGPSDGLQSPGVPLLLLQPLSQHPMKRRSGWPMPSGWAGAMLRPALIKPGDEATQSRRTRTRETEREIGGTVAEPSDRCNVANSLPCYRSI